jgi:hypothetical protein
MARKDRFSGNFFETPENPKVPELLQRNSENEVVDHEGNVYDELGNITREAPSDYLKKALEIVRKTYPNAEANHPLVQHYVDQLKAKKKQN